MQVITVLEHLHNARKTGRTIDINIRGARYQIWDLDHVTYPKHEHANRFINTLGEDRSAYTMSETNHFIVSAMVQSLDGQARRAELVFDSHDVACFGTYAEGSDA